MKFPHVLSHPVTRKVRTFVRRTVMVCAVILAVAIVTTVSVDLGPLLRSQAEQQGTRFMERPLHIGSDARPALGWRLRLRGPAD